MWGNTIIPETIHIISVPNIGSAATILRAVVVGQMFVEFEKCMHLHNMYSTLGIGHYDNWGRGHITSVHVNRIKKSITAAQNGNLAHPRYT